MLLYFYYWLSGMFTPALARPVLPRLPGRGCWWLFLRLRRDNKNWIVRWPAATRQGEEGQFIDNIALTGMVWNGESRFWPDWNCLEWRKLVLSWLDKLGMEEVGFGLSRMAWNGGCQFWPDWNSLKWRKLVWTWLEWLGKEKVNFDMSGRLGIEVLDWLEWLRLAEVGFGLPGMVGIEEVVFGKTGMAWKEANTFLFVWPE